MAGGWYGHHEAHRQAALKGWANRRRAGFSMTSEGVIMPRRTAQPARQPAQARARQPAQPPVKPPARAPRETRPTPAAPAKSSPPVRGQRGQRIRQPIEEGGRMTYAQFAAELDRLMAEARRGASGAPGAGYDLMLHHRAFATRYRREHGFS